ncbi:MAG TPA: hypothetical protein VNO26_12325 [Candidatus Limnocylindria bacterium]|nr:hypothetical protein [Candidatus Limnocylindria bacterium]
MRTFGILALFVVVATAGAAATRTSLDEFARCLTQAGARFYGTSWCPHCAAQRALFGTSFRHVAYVECSVDGTDQTTAECKQAGVTTYPTWEFADGSRETGTLSLERLAAKTGCRYERDAGIEIHDVPSGRGGVVKLPGAEDVEILELP